MCFLGLRHLADGDPQGVLWSLEGHRHEFWGAGGGGASQSDTVGGATGYLADTILKAQYRAWLLVDSDCSVALLPMFIVPPRVYLSTW